MSAAPETFTTQRMVARRLLQVADRIRRDEHRLPTLSVIGGGAASGLPTDRIRRPAAPERPPRLLVSWCNLVALLVLAAIVFGGLARGTDQLASAAEQALSPKERIGKLTHLEQEFSPEAVGSKNRGGSPIEIPGSIRTQNAAPVSAHTRVSSIFFQVNSSTHRSENHWDKPAATRDFTVHVQGAGLLYVVVEAPEYAFGIVGPIQVKPGQTPAKLAVVLSRGFDAQIRLAGPHGGPIADALVVASFRVGSEQSASFVGAQTLHSDAKGIVRFKRAIAWPVVWKAYAKKFQMDKLDAIPEPGQTRVWKLEPALPAKGRVISQATGRPVAGAEIYLFEGTDPRQQPSACVNFGTSAADGTYELQFLANATDYRAVVHAPAFGWATVDHLRAGEQDRVVTLPSALAVSGTILGPLDQLRRWSYKGTDREIWYRNPLRFSDFSNDFLQRALVRVEGKVGHFELTDLVPGLVTIEAGKRVVRLDVTAPLHDLTIDLASPDKPIDTGPTRSVVVRFKGVRSEMPFHGKLRVLLASGKPNDNEYRSIDFNGPTVRLDIPAQKSLKVSDLRAPGYCLVPTNQADVAPGDGPAEVDRDVVPAGAIHGKVVRHDGSVCVQPRMRLLVVDLPALMPAGWSPTGPRVLTNGEFLFPDLPFGGTYKILAVDDRPESAAAIFSDEIKLGEDHSITMLELTLSEGQPLRIQVVDIDGHPMAGHDVSIVARFQFGNWTSDFSKTVRTDQRGRAEFQHVQDRGDVEWLMHVLPKGRWLGYRDVVNFDSDEHELRVRAGYSARGTLKEKRSRRPLANVRVDAVPSTSRGGTICQSFALSNAKGEFAFEALQANNYQIRVHGASVPEGTQIRGGVDAPVEILVEPLDYHSGGATSP